MFPRAAADYVRQLKIGDVVVRLPNENDHFRVKNSKCPGIVFTGCMYANYYNYANLSCGRLNSESE